MTEAQRPTELDLSRRRRSEEERPGNVRLMDGILYPVYRFALIAAGLGVGALLWFVVEKTRAGMLLRAGASNAPMVSALGVDIRKLFMVVFAFGTMLAGFAGNHAADTVIRHC